MTGFICHVGYQVTSQVSHHLLDGVEPGVLASAEAAAAGVAGIRHAHARARWTGRALRVEVEGWVDPALPVADVDILARAVSQAVHHALPEARAVAFTPRAVPQPS